MLGYLHMNFQLDISRGIESTAMWKTAPKIVNHSVTPVLADLNHGRTLAERLTIRWKIDLCPGGRKEERRTRRKLRVVTHNDAPFDALLALISPVASQAGLRRGKLSSLEASLRWRRFRAMLPAEEAPDASVGRRLPDRAHISQQMKLPICSTRRVRWNCLSV